MKTVLLIGTLDTKGKEYGYVRAKLEAEGVHTILMDVSCKHFQSEFPSDFSCNEVAQAASVDFSSVSQWERLPAQKVMMEGAIRLSEELFRKRTFDGIMALGGSNGTAIACAVMQRFPVGMPKFMVSTMASGDVRGYVGWKDIVMFHPVGDISLNGMTRKIFSGAARALTGMLREDQSEGEAKKTQIALTVFGVVQACAEHAKSLLEERGYDVMVFHTSGTGGMALEELVKQGMIDGVLDISTTEVTDEAIGGVLTAGPHRMEAAGAMGIPQVIIPGAIDLVNFKTPDTVPEKWKDRVFYRHTPHITLMRTDIEESDLLGRVFAEKINQARGPSLVLIPLKGFSAYDNPKGPKAMNLQGGPASHPWFWPEADRAFYEALKRDLDFSSKVGYEELPLDINDPRFAEKAVEELDRMIKGGLNVSPIVQGRGNH
jgi:uncharacterized protein (UPF0261 family)